MISQKEWSPILAILLNKKLITKEGQQAELILVNGTPGLMQTQFTSLLAIPPYRVSQILRDKSLPKHGISGNDARELKKLGIIKPNGKGNFLPIDTVRELLSELGTPVATELCQQTSNLS
jgi:hypothetical protein